MLISAGETISGYEVMECKDIIFGVASSSESETFRQSAIKRITHAAELMKCNAIINFRLEIYKTDENTLEATAYGNAAFVRSYQELNELPKAPKINLEAYVRREKSATAEIQNANGYKFVTCPKCGTKYKADEDADGKIHIEGFEDVDDIEPGIQIFCLRCGTKFTVPDHI